MGLVNGREGVSMTNQSTRSVHPADETSLDPIDLLAALELRGATRTAPVLGGADTAIWQVETAEAAYALRLFRSDQARAAEREIAAMSAARACGLPVPRVHRDGLWGDRRAILIDWMPGQPLRHALVSDAPRAGVLGEEFGRIQAMIHQCSAPTELLADRYAWIALAAPDGALEDQLRKASGERAALLHLDYHPLNVLVEHQQVTAILDWTNARAGDPRADLARTAAILRFAPLDLESPAARSASLRRELIAGWSQGYRAVAGPSRGMAPFYTWAGAFMVRDLSPRLGRPDLPWLTEERLERVQAWTDDWRARAKRAAAPWVADHELP